MRCFALTRVPVETERYPDLLCLAIRVSTGSRNVSVDKSIGQSIRFTRQKTSTGVARWLEVLPIVLRLERRENCFGHKHFEGINRFACVRIKAQPGANE